MRLSVPAEAVWLRLARLTVAAVAGRLGFDLDAIDDVQIAVDELCRPLLAASGTGTIVIECATAPAGLEVTGTAHGPGARSGAAEPDELARRVLAAVVDAYSYDRAPVPRFWFVKRSAGPDR